MIRSARATPRAKLKHGVCRLTRYWTLTPHDHVLVMAKRRANRLGFAICRCFFAIEGGFLEPSLRLIA